MNMEMFQQVLEQQLQRCRDVLGQKASEYSTEADKLHNFKVASDIQGCSVRQAIAGMMVKHTVSVYDMAVSDKTFDVAVWDEKITDHINYLILLKAAVHEEEESQPWFLPTIDLNIPTEI